MKETRYFKPKSVTWWSSVVPLVCGLIVASEPLHHMADLVQSIRNATGMSAAALINAGLVGIGLRGAIK